MHTCHWGRSSFLLVLSQWDQSDSSNSHYTRVIILRFKYQMHLLISLTQDYRWAEFYAYLLVSEEIRYDQSVNQHVNPSQSGVIVGNKGKNEWVGFFRDEHSLHPALVVRRLRPQWSCLDLVQFMYVLKPVIVLIGLQVSLNRLSKSFQAIAKWSPCLIAVQVVFLIRCSIELLLKCY